ncbi:kinase-like protein [Gigaspora margarita]|uniref:Kinase-like protein n=1 Tax=Gigaspora margarita TaxID=4874 RepID=A0A8H4B5K9_GIGMA|nr:kinase-like protein [Gigaspora margarita]
MSYEDLFEKIDFGQKFEYASFENKAEISKGRFGTISLDNLIRKVKYTTGVNHDNIIQFLGITQDSEARTYYMVLHYANSGNLQCYLKDHFSTLDWSTKIKMAKEISSGIKCLHSENIAHRNLHNKNILVHDDIYSLGVIFWELSSGVPPFRALKLEHVIEGDRETPIDGTPVGFKDLYCAAWDGIPGHDNERIFYDFVREVKYNKVCHDNIIEFFGITQDPESKTFYIVLQYANGGDLQCYLNDHFSNLDWLIKIRMAKEISNGISYLHSTNIVHRNLKQQFCKKILLKSFNPRTYEWNKHSDIYSLGVLFWELSSGLPPFRALKKRHVINGSREIPIEGTPVDFRNLYCDAWNGKPDSRPDIEKICKKLKNMQLELFCKNFSNFKYSFSEKPKKIGEGGFGVIHKAYLEEMKQIVALKTLDHDDEEAFIREVKYTSKVNHDNIIKFFGIIHDPKTETYYMILQYAYFGDLEYYLNAHSSNLDWSTRIRMAKEISNGINCLHEANIVHRDLGRMVITDFGLSKSLDDGTESISSGVFGRPAYCDPNYLLEPFKYKWNKHFDVYSIGFIFWELSSGVSPFKQYENSPTTITNHLRRGQRERPIEGTPIDFQNLYAAA